MPWKSCYSLNQWQPRHTHPMITKPVHNKQTTCTHVMTTKLLTPSPTLNPWRPSYPHSPMTTKSPTSWQPHNQTNYSQSLHDNQVTHTNTHILHGGKVTYTQWQPTHTQPMATKPFTLIPWLPRHLYTPLDNQASHTHYFMTWHPNHSYSVHDNEVTHTYCRTTRAPSQYK